MKRSVVFFDAKEHAVCQQEEFSAELEHDQILVKMDYDLISTGTETANFLQLPNTVTADHGFPHYPGYTASGHVEAIGSEVTQFKPGDRVVVKTATHRSRVIQKEQAFYPIPDGVSQEEAAFAFLATFPMLGVRKLNLQLGEPVMIAGLGLLGQFAVSFARYAGACPVLACDFSPERRALAEKSGADFVLNPGEPDFVKKVIELTGGGPKGVVEVTGHIQALQQALEYVAWEGRISLLGCTRIADTPIDFYKYVHRRGIQLIGCHNHARPNVESRQGEWTTFDDFSTFFKLILHRQLPVSSLISRIVSPLDAGKIYTELAHTQGADMGVVLDWRNID